MTLSGRDVSELLAAHGLHPSRALGQNFVVDPNTVRRIARLAEVGPGDRVIEIGAGLGSLTLALAETGADVTAVEVDRGLVPVLREVVEPVGVRVVEADALTVDWRALLGDDDWSLVANLPYNVATPLVADLLDGVPQITRMLVMVQREVGERLAARVGDEGYGAVSVKVAYWARAEVVGRGAGDGLPAEAEGRVRARAHRAPRRRPRSPTSIPSGCSRSCAQASVTAARCCAARSPASRRWSSSRLPVSHPRRARRSSTSMRGDAWLARLHRVADVVVAPAKLTVSLRITGVRDDGYHLIDAEMVSLDLADRLTISEGDGLEIVGPAAGGIATDDTNLVRRALAAVGRRAHVRVEKHIPAGAGLGGGSSDAAAILRWAGVDDLAVAASVGADVPFCLVGGRARVTGIGEIVEPLPFVAAHLHHRHAAVRRLDRRGLPGVGHCCRPVSSGRTTSSRPRSGCSRGSDRGAIGSHGSRAGLPHARGQRIDVVRRGRSP